MFTQSGRSTLSYSLISRRSTCTAQGRHGTFCQQSAQKHPYNCVTQCSAGSALPCMKAGLQST